MAIGSMQNKIKGVNMTQIEKFETVETDSKTVACGGPNGALGHPKVFLEITKDDTVTCPYCSKKFVYKK